VVWEIATFKNRAFLPYNFKAAQKLASLVPDAEDNSGRWVFNFTCASAPPVRNTHGAPTAENAVRLLSNLVMCKAVAGEMPPGSIRRADWEKLTCDYWAQMLGEHDGMTVYCRKRIGVDAASITLYHLLDSSICSLVTSTEEFFTKKLRKLTMRYFKESPHLRNSMITLWLGMFNASKAHTRL